MTKQLGPTFGNEVIAAGLGGAPFSWGLTDDLIIGRDRLTGTQNTTLDDVIAAHDPTAQLPPIVQPSTAVLFNHENRIRATEGVPPISLGDFRTQNNL